MPRPAIDRLNAEFVRAAKDPEVVKRLADQGIDALSDTPEEFAALIRSETMRWTEVAKTSGSESRLGHQGEMTRKPSFSRGQWLVGWSFVKKQQMRSAPLVA